MKFSYDKKVDALYIHLNPKAKYSHSEKIAEGMVVDVTKAGKPIGIEILDASEVISGFNPKKVDISYSKTAFA